MKQEFMNVRFIWRNKEVYAEHFGTDNIVVGLSKSRANAEPHPIAIASRPLSIASTLLFLSATSLLLSIAFCTPLHKYNILSNFAMVNSLFDWLPHIIKRILLFASLFAYSPKRLKTSNFIDPLLFYLLCSLGRLHSWRKLRCCHIVTVAKSFNRSSLFKSRMRKIVPYCIISYTGKRSYTNHMYFCLIPMPHHTQLHTLYEFHIPWLESNWLLFRGMEPPRC